MRYNCYFLVVFFINPKKIQKKYSEIKKKANFMQSITCNISLN